MENEMVVVPEVKYDLSVARAPKQVLAEAQEAAKALESVIATRKSAVKFNGKQYLTFEDWQTCGKFYGVTARVVSTEVVEIGEAKGFIARAEAISVQSGQVVSAAESMCLNDEPNWQKKPLFQLRSMAQTRACAKSLRNCLAWVVVLAGFEPSVAEEMTGDEHETKAAPIAPPKAKEAAPTLKDTQDLFTPLEVKTLKTGESDKGAWTLYGIVKDAKTTYVTFSESHAEEARRAIEDKKPVSLIFKRQEKNGKVSLIVESIGEVLTA